MPGPSPKPAATRQRRNRAATGHTFDVTPVAKVGLPFETPHRMTVAWWDTIWASPMVEEWVDADVPGLFVLASLVDEFWTKGDPKVAAEIRMQQREYGLSPLSRRSLQWEIRRVETAKAAPPVTRQRDPRLRAVS